ncbi:ABC transporter permease [Aquabacter spiritensis]|uniref:ABC-type nitrate/sulfonate/bicarbonate transport system permease component n=1 Tax=Aquabacter spiritensis TaxID=933073 RepID=A0A4R3M211_9HYPH|nr:ABC transporter permease subunit [Aquabacter spiritensis]TCT06763.1 ABC-type nitrate/sulfonate/bicarbonate transport system permease component [Aquabacter spiritensis]
MAVPRALRERWRSQSALVLDLVLIAVVWQVSTYFLPPIVAPGLSAIGRALLDIFIEPDLRIHLIYTSLRVLVSLLGAFIIGTAVGLMMGGSDWFRDYMRPLLNLMQGIPALSWIVFAVIWFTEVEVRIAFIILMVTIPTFALQVDSAVRGVNLDFIQLAQAFRASRMQRYAMVLLPAIVPAIISVWSVNLGNAIRVAVVAELIGATTGVGFQLLNAQAVLDMAAAIAWTLSLVLVLFFYQGIIMMIERRLLAWRPKGEQA